MRDIAISRIMTTNPITIGPDETVAAAEEIFDSQGIHHLPVVAEGKLVGILSTADFLKLNMLRERDEAMATIRVRQIMEAEPITLDTRADLIDVASKLIEGSFHALPVVEEGGELVGIVTSSDLIGHLLMQVPRSDGSIRAAPGEEAPGRISDADLTATIRLARAAVDSGRPDKMAEVVLYLREQNRLLKEVCKAAELYMRSGHGEHEHAVLQKTLDSVQRAAST